MSIYKQSTDRWYLERIIFLVAGLFILVSTTLAVMININFLYFTAFVGLVMTLFALTGYCPMAIALSKLGVKEK